MTPRQCGISKELLLGNDHGTMKTDDLEKEAVSILSTLIEERLHFQARKVCELLLPLLGQYSKE